jgi:hypothetical protein
MKKGSKWFKLLSEKEQQEFKENCGDFEMRINDKYISFELFVLCCFPWKKTKQGVKYWNEISERYT